MIITIIPIRCFSCGKPVGGLWEKYTERVEKGESPKKALDDLGIDRYCCRALFMTHKDVLQKVSKFKI